MGDLGESPSSDKGLRVIGDETWCPRGLRKRRDSLTLLVIYFFLLSEPDLWSILADSRAANWAALGMTNQKVGLLRIDITVFSIWRAAITAAR